MLVVLGGRVPPGFGQAFGQVTPGQVEAELAQRGIYTEGIPGVEPRPAPIIREEPPYPVIVRPGPPTPPITPPAGEEEMYLPAATPTEGLLEKLKISKTAVIAGIAIFAGIMIFGAKPPAPRRRPTAERRPRARPEAPAERAPARTVRETVAA